MAKREVLNGAKVENANMGKTEAMLGEISLSNN